MARRRRGPVKGSKRWIAIGEHFLVKWVPEKSYIYVGTANQKFLALVAVHPKGLRLYLRDRRKHAESKKASSIIIPGEYRLDEVVRFIIAKTGVNKGTFANKAWSLNRKVVDWSEGAVAKRAAAGEERYKDEGKISVGELMRRRDLAKALKGSGLWSTRGRLRWSGVPLLFFRAVPLEAFVQGSTRSLALWWRWHLAQKNVSYSGLAEALSVDSRLSGELKAAAGAYETLTNEYFDSLHDFTNREPTEEEEQRLTELRRREARARSIVVRAVLKRRYEREKAVIEQAIMKREEANSARRVEIATKERPPVAHRYAMARYAAVRGAIAGGALIESPFVIRRWNVLARNTRKRGRGFIETLFVAWSRGWTAARSWNTYASQLDAFYRSVLIGHTGWLEDDSFDDLVSALMRLPKSRGAAAAVNALINGGMSQQLFCALELKTLSEVRWAEEAHRAYMETFNTKDVDARHRYERVRAYKPPIVDLPDGWTFTRGADFYQLGTRFSCCISNQAYYAQQLASGNAHVVYRTDGDALAFIGWYGDRWAIEEISGHGNSRVGAGFRREAEFIASKLNSANVEPCAPTPAIPIGQGVAHHGHAIVDAAASPRFRAIAEQIVAHYRRHRVLELAV